ncbi:MAG: MarR family winged helix-turn-helix transcriptional regulator [Dehalococcoidia bacterium]
MPEDNAPSRVEARFIEWMAAHGADRSRFWAAYNLISAGDLLVALYSEALHHFHITRDEWRILLMLELVTESEPRRLAESLWLGRSTVVNAVTRLEKRGLVVREPASNDRRLVIVRITPEGRELMEQGTNAEVDRLMELSWDLTKEETDLIARLARNVWISNYTRVPKSILSSPRVGDAQH